MNSIRPTFSRARVAQLFILLCIVASLVNIYSETLQLDLIQSVIQGSEITDEVANANDFRVLLINSISTFIFVGSIITFIMWFRRSYYNLHQKTGYLSFPEGMAAGAWFIPFVNFYRPFQILRELFTKTVDLYEEHEITYPQPISALTMGLWWSLWILANVLSRIASKVLGDEGNLTSYLDASNVTIASEIVLILAGILLMQIIRSYESLSEQLHELPDENIFLVEQVPPTMTPHDTQETGTANL